MFSVLNHQVSILYPGRLLSRSKRTHRCEFWEKTVSKTGHILLMGLLRRRFDMNCVTWFDLRKEVWGHVPICHHISTSLSMQEDTCTSILSIAGLFFQSKNKNVIIKWSKMMMMLMKIRWERSAPIPGVLTISHFLILIFYTPVAANILARTFADFVWRSSQIGQFCGSGKIGNPFFRRTS